MLMVLEYLQMLIGRICWYIPRVCAVHARCYGSRCAIALFSQAILVCILQ